MLDCLNDCTWMYVFRQDQYASIDLSDNEIVKLEGFPHLKRLTSLIVNNNRIARINSNIGGTRIFTPEDIFVTIFVQTKSANIKFSVHVLTSVAAALPKLETLVLTNNRISNLADLDHLATLVNLQNLCVLENVVTKRPNYRLYLIHKLPKLRLLDFKKIQLKVHMKHLVLCHVLLCWFCD